MIKKLLIAILMLLIGGGSYVGMEKLGSYGGSSNAMYRNLTNSSSTVPSATGYGIWTTNPVPVISENTGRIWLRICKVYGLDTFWLHFTNATSSGIGVNEGTELSTTTPCLTLDSNGMWLGKIWGVGNTTTTLFYAEASQ